MEIGAQLFTLRDYCKTLPDFAETLKRVADIGYKTVQVSGTCAYEPQWLKEQLEANGLRCVITHFDPNRIRTDAAKVAEDHAVFSCHYIGIGCMPGALEQPEDYDRFAEGFQDAAKELASRGALLMYHNHHMEFMKAADGKLYIEKLAEVFSPDTLGFTLDTYWVQYGGGDPAEWLEKLSGRVPCIHLKDMACVKKEPRMAPIGEGNLNFKRIFSAAEAAGTKYMLVEQDSCYGEDPFDCLRRSYQYLHSFGFR